MRLRSLIALILLVGYGISSAEVVVGELRDGEVHHETVATALDHQDASQGDHGHEDPGEDPEHGPDHEHGTAGDHCTHTHSASLPAAHHFVTMSCSETRFQPASLSYSSAASGSLFHPPKI